MGRGRRTCRGNRYFGDDGVRKARLKTNRFVPDRCNTRAASTGGNSRNVIGLPVLVESGNSDRKRSISGTKPIILHFPGWKTESRNSLSDHAPMTKYFPTSKTKRL